MTGIGVLGPVAIIDEDGVATVLRGERPRLLLALLAARVDQVVDVDVLVDALWGEELPANPAAALQSQVHRLRRALGPIGPSLVTTERGYRLTGVYLDVTRFERLVEQAHQRGALADVDAALGLWRGRAFGDAADHDALRPAAQRLDAARVDARELQAELLLATGRFGDAARTAAQLSADEPYREGPVSVQMRALAIDGRRVEGLRVFHEFRERLVDEIGVEPSPSLRAVEAELLRNGTAEPPTIGLPGNSFIGRDDEVTQVVELLGHTRLVSLTGPGGVGKTRLAAHVAVAVADRFPDGVHLCELAAVHESHDVPAAVAAALGIDDRSGRHLNARIADYLRSARVLVLLDNCEHVLDGAAALAGRLLTRTSRTVILATSRHRLGVAGEHLVLVAALDSAGDRGSSAVQLFVDRVREVRPDVRLSTDDYSAILELTRLLGGLPLAIELAAARMVGRTPAEIVDDLRQPRRRAVVAGARHGSVETTIDWSYGLLTRPEQAAYRRLSVFARGWTADAARAVIGDADVVDVLISLVEHSLVQARPADGQTRYSMLEPIRRHAEQLLDGDDASLQVRARHASWVASSIEAADAGLRGPEEALWVRRIEAEIANVRSALRYALDHQTAEAIRIAAGLFWYAYFRGNAELFGWVDETIERVDTGDPATAGAFATAAVGAWRRGDLERSMALATRGIELAGTGDPASARFAWEALRSAALLVGDNEGSIAHRNEALKLARQIGDTVHEAHTHATGALALGYLGRFDEAVQELATASALLDQKDNPTTRAMCAYVAGEIRVEAAPSEALVHLRVAQRLAAEADNDLVSGIAGASAVSCATRTGEVDLRAYADVIEYFHRAGVWTQLLTAIRSLIQALALVGAAEDAAVLVGTLQGARFGAPIVGADAERLLAVVADLQLDLGERRYAELETEGRALRKEDAIARARAAIAEHGAIRRASDSHVPMASPVRSVGRSPL